MEADEKQKEKNKMKKNWTKFAFLVLMLVTLSGCLLEKDSTIDKTIVSLFSHGQSIVVLGHPDDILDITRNKTKLQHPFRRAWSLRGWETQVRE